MESGTGWGCDPQPREGGSLWDAEDSGVPLEQCGVLKFNERTPSPREVERTCKAREVLALGCSLKPTAT